MATSKYHLSPSEKLKRFLYTSSENPTYITGNAEQHNSYVPDKAKIVAEIIQSQKPEVLLDVIEIVNRQNLAPRRESLFFALALALWLTESAAYKQKIRTILLDLIKSAEDLCIFLKFYTKLERKFNSVINKIISSYYSKKEPLALAKEVSKSKGYHTWTHKDLLKLSHCRCNSVLTTIVVTYVLYGLPRAMAMADGNPDADKIINHLSKVNELKQSENEHRIVELINELHCDVIRVPSFFHGSQLVWEALIPGLPLIDLITYLPRLYKLGFLKEDVPFLREVVKALTNISTIYASKVHPVEVFIGLRNFQEGGKPADPKCYSYSKSTAVKKEEDPNSEVIRKKPNCPKIIWALHRTMTISFKNPPHTGRIFMITIDLTVKMQKPCLNNRNLTCLDAASILTLSLLKAERNVTVAVFNGTKISIVSLENNVRFYEVVGKLKNAKSGYVMQSSVFEWASNQKKKVDVFINILFNHHWRHSIPKEFRDKEEPIENFNKYKKTMNLPHTKLITFSLSSPQLSVADGSRHILDVCGFTNEVPKVIEAFSKGLF